MLLVWLALLVLVTRIVSSISTSAFAEIVWSVYKRVSPSGDLRSLREKRVKLNEVRAERAATSSQDEFAKWARLDRQHQSLKKELDALNASVASTRARVTMIIGVVRWFATTGVKFYVQWKYRATPVVWLPPNNALPGIIEWSLSLPKAPRGSISTASWIVLTDGAVNGLLRIYKLAQTAKSPANVPQSHATTSAAAASPPASPRKSKLQ